MSKRILTTVILGMIIIFILVGRFISFCEKEDGINKVARRDNVSETAVKTDEIKMFYNAWVVSEGNGMVTFFHDGVLVEMECELPETQLSETAVTGTELPETAVAGTTAPENAMPESAPHVSFVADIEIRNGKVAMITEKSDRRRDRILVISEQVSEQPTEQSTHQPTEGTAHQPTQQLNGQTQSTEPLYSIETLTHGTLAFSPFTACYDISEPQKPSLINVAELPIGYDVTELVFGGDGSICAVLVTQKVVPQYIRVAIKTSSYKSHYHEKIVINSDAGVTVTQNGVASPVAAGQKLEYDINNPQLQVGRIIIAPTEGGKIYIDNVKRGYKNPAYRGTIELTLQNEGIVVVNELTIDEYLYSVVPSEMPVGYGVEALKVQAVCARTYAYIHVKNSTLSHLGAHVDDSTSYQVYNNTKETAESVEAVNATRGQVVTYNGEVVPTYYYSTSCGVSAKGKDVWFGMKDVPYLKSNLQTTQMNLEALALDLSDDAQFKSFLEREDIITYDSNFAWYRWKVTMNSETVKKSIEASLEKRYNANPSLILTKSKNGDYVSEPVTTVGDILNIKIARRTESGLVTQIIIKGTEHTIKVKSEYNIRLLLAPLTSAITRKDGSVVDSLSILPSAFMVMSHKGKGANKEYTIQGGGYGHGVGMSQNGTRSLVLAGYTHTDILKFYYSGCEVTTMN